MNHENVIPSRTATGGPTATERADRRSLRAMFFEMLLHPSRLAYNIQMLLQANFGTGTDVNDQWMRVLEWVKPPPPGAREKNYRAALVTILAGHYEVAGGEATKAFRALTPDQQEHLGALIDKEVADAREMFPDEIYYSDAPKEVRDQFFRGKASRVSAEGRSRPPEVGGVDWQI